MVEQSKEELIEKLQQDKKKLESKIKNLGQVLEIATKKKPKPEKGENLKEAHGDMKEYVEEMKRSIKTLGKKMETPSKAHDERIGQVTSELLKPFEEKLKALEKINDFEIRLARMEGAGKKEEPEKEKKKPGLFGGFAQDIVETKDQEDARIATETRLEKRLNDMQESISSMKIVFGSRSLKELEELINNSNELVNNVVPSKVREEMERMLSSFAGEFRAISQTLQRLTDTIEKSNSELFYSMEEIERMGSDVQRLETRIDNIHKDLIKSIRDS
ncbi:MAG: hypothetical protein ABIJ92_03210 [Candidatus Aenigmatarchaeota archaeon]